MKTIIERGASWTLEETKLLLALWGEDLVQRQQTQLKRTKETYEKIAERFNQNGFERSADQIRTRVFNMIAEYRRILKDPTPERLKKCIFFDPLHRIYLAKHMDDVRSALDDYEPDMTHSPTSTVSNLMSESLDEHQASDNEAGVPMTVNGENTPLKKEPVVVPTTTTTTTATSSTNSTSSASSSTATTISSATATAPATFASATTINPATTTSSAAPSATQPNPTTTATNAGSSLLLPHATPAGASGPSSTATTSGGTLLTNKPGTSNNAFISINNAKLPFMRANGFSDPTASAAVASTAPNINLTSTPARLQPTTATVAGHHLLYQAPVNTFDVTSSALLIDRMFAHLSRESENMREWIALEKERLALERAKRAQEAEREARRERVLIDTLMRIQDQWISFITKLDPKIIENAPEPPPEIHKMDDEDEKS